MNLNALWNPVGVNGVLYSRLLPAQNQIDGNYDAFAYLGLGVLAALPITLAAARRRALTGETAEEAVQNVLRKRK